MGYKLPSKNSVKINEAGVQYNATNFKNIT